MSGSATTIEDVLAQGTLHALYQPIVDLATSEVVAYEALIRGPAGTSLERPDQLFAAAAVSGLVEALDWECMAAAFRGALRAGLGRRAKLFVNVEPSTFGTARPPRMKALFAEAQAAMTIIFEITERAIIRDPAGLVDSVDEVREIGFGIAIDDVGADPTSIALMPFIHPDVIKLDLRLVHAHADDEITEIAAAATAEASRRGARILAEGIETELHLDRALALGATLGQGWYFGRPSELPSDMAAHEVVPEPFVGGLDQVLTPRVARPAHVRPTPWQLVAGSPRVRVGSKDELVALSKRVESQAMTMRHVVVISTFQHHEAFTAATARRYESLAGTGGLVGAIGVDFADEPAPGVRGGRLLADHPLAEEWIITVIGPHHAAALIAREIPAFDAAGNRQFEFVLTDDRELVTAASRSLIQHLPGT